MEMLIFRHYQVDSKEIKCPLQWWEKHEVTFPIVVFLTQHFFGTPNPRDCLITNWDWKDFFFSKDTYKLENMLFVITKFREIDICEQKLAK
jgi:hypothetical protein